MRISVSLLKIREFTENKAGRILNLMDKITKVFFTEKTWEKTIFHFEKQNLEHVGNSLHTTEYLAFGKVLLASLKLKVYITKLLSVFIIYEKSHALNEVILFGLLTFLRIPLTLKTYLYWALNELQFSNFVSLMTYLSCFLLFSPQWTKRKRNKNKLFKYF